MSVRLRRAVLFLVGMTIPMQGLALGGGALVATPFKFMVGALLVVAGTEFALGQGGRPRDSKTVWVIAFAASFGVSSAMSAIGGVPFEVILGPGTTLAALTLYYFLLSYAAREREDLRTILWGVVFGGTITLVPAVALMGQAQTAQAQRFEGLAGQSNTLGADMVVCFALSAGLFFTTPRRSARAFAFFAGAMALMGVAFSLSRSAFLALAVMWVVWIVRAGRRDNLAVAIVAIMLGVVTVAAAPDFVRDRFFTMVDARQRQEDRSIQTRLDTNVVALKAFASNPVIGVGAERFRLWAFEEKYGRLHTVHNAYLYIAAEQGLFGLIPFLALLILSWRDYARTWREARRHRLIRDGPLTEYGNLALYLQLSLLSIMIGGMFHQQHRLKMVWTVMALSPLVASLMRMRVAEIRGLRDKPEPDGLLGPAVDDDGLAGRHPAH